MLTLERDGAESLVRQIHAAIREAILSGRLAGGMRIPPTRVLARDLGVARTTVVQAYEQLLLEGYLRGRGSAGTFVVELRLPQAAQRSGLRAGATVTLPVTGAAPAPRPFRIGEPALDLFPVKLWTRLCTRRARTSARDFLTYGDGAGYWPLRRAIADYTAASRAVRASAEQVILVRGAQQAVDMIARELVEPGDEVWYEDPGYLAARRLFERAGARIVPVPVDGEGLVIGEGCARAPLAKVVYVAPSHQFPLGSALSLERRLALLSWSAGVNAWVVEDDYDSEFRYPGRSFASLQGLDRAGRVIYVGTFSKTVFPALRLGYLIVPPELVDRFGAARRTLDCLAPTLEQAVLTDFIEEGHFTRHLRRMRSAYRERQQALLAAAQAELADLMVVEPADAGMHVIAWLPGEKNSDRAVAAQALARGIEVQPLSAYCMRAAPGPALLLGFACVRPDAMTPALRTLRSILQHAGRIAGSDPH